jgi:hypothetical protein
MIHHGLWMVFHGIPLPCLNKSPKKVHADRWLFFLAYSPAHWTIMRSRNFCSAPIRPRTESHRLISEWLISGRLHPTLPWTQKNKQHCREYLKSQKSQSTCLRHKDRIPIFVLSMGMDQNLWYHVFVEWTSIYLLFTLGLIRQQVFDAKPI